MNNISIKLLHADAIDEIVNLTRHLNPNHSLLELKERQSEMFQLNTYTCFGLYDNETLIGITSGWITVRLYSGKQLEIDNVIINPEIQSKGYGKYFISEIEAWAKNNGCLTVELNTYVANSRSHKFYFNQGYKILGFHFQKELE
jgi:GNAT superfamily N-acetyltransferase